MDGWNQERERRRIIIFLEEEICENAQLKRNGVRTEQCNKTTEEEKLHCIMWDLAFLLSLLSLLMLCLCCFIFKIKYHN